MTDKILAYDHTRPDQPPRQIPARWLGQPWASQFSTDKPRTTLDGRPAAPTTKKES